jgi:hypothetical protein
MGEVNVVGDLTESKRAQQKTQEGRRIRKRFRASMTRGAARLLAMVLLFLMAVAVRAQHIPGYNYDEQKIPPYAMLDPLQLADGSSVTKPAVWWSRRRPEILHLFEENVFGRTPADAHVPLRTRVLEEDRAALGGTAIRKQVDLFFTEKSEGGPYMRLLLYLPAHAAAARIPVVLGLNFGGNQTVLDDPKIQPTDVWSRPRGTMLLDHAQPEEATRGSQIEEWQVRMLLAHGYGLATAYYGDLEPDFKGASHYSVRQLFLKPGLTTAQTGDDWGAIGAWAWGLSRALDYLRTDPDVDPAHIAVTGHSRLGKAADWAAAQDQRFAAVLSTESGKGGQSLSRRGLGESVAHLEHSFPYWFCPNYAKWVNNDQQIPADGNLLLSLIAPRPLYVASAVGDEWSDPHGEFLSAVSASRVYRLLGVGGLMDSSMPAVDQPVHGGNVAYHMRAGKHDVTAFDWEQYLVFLDAHFPHAGSAGRRPVGRPRV